MKIVKLLFIPLVLFLSCSSVDDSIYDTLLDMNSFNSQNVSQITKNIIFKEDDLPNKKYSRIPTVIIANNGSILAACEKRNQFEDKGDMDILLAVSSNKGKSYHKEILFQNDIKNGRKMNPSFVVDRFGYHGAVGRIYCFVLSVLNPNKYGNQLSKGESNTLYKYSDDNGLTWSHEFELNAKFPKNCIVFGSSPANGIQLKNGTLVIPAFVAFEDNSYRSGIVFKTPKGDWEFSYINLGYSYTDNECTILPSIDGNSVIVNSRAESMPHRNIYQSSEIVEGVKGPSITWTNHTSNALFKVPGPCQASLEVIPGNSPTYLFSNPAENPRKYICIWSSSDIYMWTPRYLVTRNLSAGYSVLTYYKNRLLVIYESNSKVTECEIQDISPLLNYLKNNVYDNEGIGK